MAGQIFRFILGIWEINGLFICSIKQKDDFMTFFLACHLSIPGVAKNDVNRVVKHACIPVLQAYSVKIFKM